MNFTNRILHSIFGLKNTTGTAINPATEEKQDDIISDTTVIKGDTTSLDAKAGTTGEAADVDGTRAGQLRYIGEKLEEARALLATIDADTGSILLNQTNKAQLSQITDGTDEAGIASSYTMGQFIDQNGAAYGVKHVDNKPRVSCMPYLYDIAEGNVDGHSDLFKIGYNPEVTTTEEDLWSAGGTYVWPTAEMGMEAVSDNAADAGTVIKGDATGDTVSADADSTTTLLEDDDVDFTAATIVEVGDCVIIDPHGDNPYPAWGYVTAVAEHTLTIANGLNNGQTMASKPYAVIDVSGALTGAKVVGITYLDSDYVQHGELIVLNGVTPVATINTDIFRINSFAVVATGTGCKAAGALSVRHLDDTPEYSHITAGYSISRQLIFTVPAGYTGYITGGTVSASNPNDSKVQTARVIMRTNVNPDFEFLTGCIFYPKAEIVVCNETVPIHFESPIKIIEKSDFIVSGQGFTGFSGPITAVFRGWLEEN